MGKNRILGARLFHAGRVEYYDERDGGSPRWALPDQIAMSKFKSYQWQDEFRFVFCLTDALGFEKAALRLVKGDAREAPKPAETEKQRESATPHLQEK